MGNLKDSAFRFSLFLAYGIWFISSFPARMSPDSFAVWGEVLAGRWTDWHTLSYTFFVWLTSAGGNFLWCTSLVQLSFLVYALQHLIRTLFRDSRNLEISVSLFFAVTPWIGAFGVTIWKDIPYTSLQVLSLSFLIRYLEFKDKNLILRALFFGSASILFRHNGWPTIILFAVFVIILLRKQLFLTREIKIIGPLIIVFFSTVQVIVPHFVAGSSSPAWFKSMPLMADVSYAIQKDISNPVELKRVLSSYAGPQAQSGILNCASINGLIFSPDFNSAQAGELNGFYLETWLSYLFKDPKILIEPHLCRVNNFLPPPFAAAPNYYYWIQSGIVANTYGVSSSAPKVLSSLIDGWTYFWERVGIQITNPGKWWLMSALVLLFLRNRKPSDHLGEQAKVIFLWCTASSIILLLAAVAQDVRYAYPFLIPAILIAIKFFSKIQVIREKS